VKTLVLEDLVVLSSGVVIVPWVDGKRSAIYPPGGPRHLTETPFDTIKKGLLDDTDGDV